MKKNLYYRTVAGRENFLKAAILGLAMGLSSYPRLLLEVFIRKDFGERYFKFISVVTLALVLGAVPFLANYGGFSIKNFILHDFTYCAYLVLFVLFGYWHEKDIKRSKSSFDFGRYSLCSGSIHPYFKEVVLPWNGKKPTVRQIECFVEAAPFFFTGLVLLLLQQKLGALLTICSVIYALSYVGSYASGDSFVLNKIDEMIVNQEMEKAFVEDADMSETKGFQYRGRKPASEEIRRKVLPHFTEENETLKEEIFVAN